MTFGDNLARLKREIADLKSRNARQAETITALNRKVQERGSIIKRQDRQLRAMEKELGKLRQSAN